MEKPDHKCKASKSKEVYPDFECYCRLNYHRYQTTEDRAQERSEREEREEKARFEKAKKITMAEYDGSQFFYNDYYPTDELHSFIDDEWCAGGEAFIPRYVWAARPEKVLKKRDAYTVFENDIVDAGWVEICWEDVKGVEELDAALAKFCQANEKFRVFYPDYSTAISIEKEVDEYLSMLEE
jgi:hypothetical protein